MQVVSTSPLIKTYTLEEFWKLPEPKDGTKLELIAGVLYMSPPPDFPHNFTSSDLNMLFSEHLLKTQDKGRLFIPRAALWTGAATYVEPDLFYVSARTLKRVDWSRPDTADLVVEVISPGTAIYDRNTKADTYAALGVRELWLVDPQNETVEVRNLKRVKKGQKGSYGAGRIFKRGERVESKVLAKFSPPVSEICRAVPRKSK
ncbi:MAG TPA: Uma2 family endonuclease [Blastocatellia bacterium]|nr:Uma2 family endonuclease [Blastocatellia bacterium]